MEVSPSKIALASTFQTFTVLANNEDRCQAPSDASDATTQRDATLDSLAGHPSGVPAGGRLLCWSGEFASLLTIQTPLSCEPE